jgi:hypothetical protein
MGFISKVGTTLGCLGFALLVIGGPGLIIAGLIAAGTNPCWFRQFPPEYCTSANDGPGSTAVTLWTIGAVLLLVLAVLGLAAHAARWARSQDNRDRTPPG